MPVENRSPDRAAGSSSHGQAGSFRSDGKSFAIIQAGADDDVEYLRAVNGNRFECLPNRIESELSGHDLAYRRLQVDSSQDAVFAQLTT
jgi:hypothetical protein